MSAPPSPLRVVQWTTGNVARQALRAIRRRADLELVGVYAYSADKVGKDAGELAGLDERVGVAATNDIDAILALEPDCVLYMPLHPDIGQLTTLLRAGINVLSTAAFITGRSYGEAARAELNEAALAGGASLFGSGVNPGFADYLTAVASGVSRDVTHVRVMESFNIGTWAGDANQDELGWGRPAGDPGHADDIVAATAVFGDAVESMAEMFGVTLDEIRCDVDFAHAVSDTAPSPAGTSKPEASRASRPAGSAASAAPTSSRPPCAGRWRRTSIPRGTLRWRTRFRSRATRR